MRRMAWLMVILALGWMPALATETFLVPNTFTSDLTNLTYGYNLTSSTLSSAAMQVSQGELRMTITGFTKKTVTIWLNGGSTSIDATLRPGSEAGTYELIANYGAQGFVVFVYDATTWEILDIAHTYDLEIPEIAPTSDFEMLMQAMAEALDQVSADIEHRQSVDAHERDLAAWLTILVAGPHIVRQDNVIQRKICGEAGYADCEYCCHNESVVDKSCLRTATICVGNVQSYCGALVGTCGGISELEISAENACIEHDCRGLPGDPICSPSTQCLGYCAPMCGLNSGICGGCARGFDRCCSFY
ncbi:MAG TPA: hypothetical protein VFD06_08495 [Candidatus Polarisedimenticolia bacterium]|nr:hypothetical protein [Candidatus Polarisedimenticolia bacterium]